MTSGSNTTEYNTLGIYLSPNAAQQAQLLQARTIAANRAGMAAIHHLVMDYYPRSDEIALFKPREAAYIIRLANFDKRFTATQPEAHFTPAVHIERAANRAVPLPTKELLTRTHPEGIIEITVPSLFTDARWGAAYARGLLEHSRLHAPSDDVMGDAESIRLQNRPDVLETLGTAQRSDPRLFIVVNS